jgi:hypothetical protein
MQRLQLAAYGNSLFLKGIAACLACHMGLRVDLIDPDAPDARECLNQLNPDAIAFELHTAWLAVPMELLQQTPGLLLVLLDPGSEEILVLSGQRTQPTTAGALGDVLLSTMAQPA